MTGHAAHSPSLWISQSDDGVATWSAIVAWEREDQVGEKERLYLPQLGHIFNKPDRASAINIDAKVHPMQCLTR